MKTKDCLLHSDYHAFNILVEGKSNPERLDEFGAVGSVTICDWEMALAGPIGRDLGILYAFPMLNAVKHAMNGDDASTNSILDALDAVWDNYERTLKEEGSKSDEFIGYAFQDVIAWTGWFCCLANYIFPFHIGSIQFETYSSKEIFMESAGVLGLKFFDMGFDDALKHAPLADLWMTFRHTIMHEMRVGAKNMMLCAPPPRHGHQQAKRRSSVLRSTG
jgi:hypothetical protein